MKTKNLSKKGFSMIELLFVMVIIAVLSAIAIPNFQSDSAKIISMKSDAKNAVSMIKSAQGDSEIMGYEITETAADGDTVSFTADGAYGNSLIGVSKENEILLTDLRGSCKDGFSIQVSDTEGYITNTIDFNSCTDSKISVTVVP